MISSVTRKFSVVDRSGDSQSKDTHYLSCNHDDACMAQVPPWQKKSNHVLTKHTCYQMAIVGSFVGSKTPSCNHDNGSLTECRLRPNPPVILTTRRNAASPSCFTYDTYVPYLSIYTEIFLNSFGVYSWNPIWGTGF